MTLHLPTSSSRRRPRAFTLIEILVVIAVIVILAGITVAVGTQVKKSAQHKQTLLELQALSGYMDQYLAQGNPEPAAALTDTTPNSDEANWVKALRSSQFGPKLSAYPSGVDGGGNMTILDKYGRAIRYIPSNPATKTKGYFQSAGPDTVFFNTTPTPSPMPPQDDIFSTEAM